VPTQSAPSSVAATPPAAFLRCRLSGTLDDGAPLGIIQQRDFGGFRGRFHRRPVTRRWRSLSFSDGGSGDDWFAIPGELTGREWFATHSAVVPGAGGRLHRPDDGQVEPREVAVGRRAIAFLGRLTIGSPRAEESRLAAAYSGCGSGNLSTTALRRRSRALSRLPPWHCSSAVRAGGRAEATVPRSGRARLDARVGR
jgi:hypothetical protein